MDSNSKILVAGSGGLVGSAIVRKLKKLGFNNLLTPRRKELDLINQKEVKRLKKQEIHRRQSRRIKKETKHIIR